MRSIGVGMVKNIVKMGFYCVSGKFSRYLHKYKAINEQI